MTSKHYAEVLRDDPLAFWRMSDTTYVENVYRYNKAPNPALQVDASGNFHTYSYGSSGIPNHPRFGGARVASGGPLNNSAFWRATATETWPLRCWVAAGDITPVVGKTYTCSAYVRTNKTRTVHLQVESLRADGSTAGMSIGDNIMVQANTWTRLARSATIPTGSTKMRLDAVIENIVPGDTLDITNILYEVDTTEVLPYFDGNSANSAWDGTVGKSSSTYTEQFTRRWMDDERGVFRGQYSETGITYQGGLTLPEGGDTCSVFAPAGSATVVAGSDAWNFSTHDFVSSIQADISAVGTLVSVEGTGVKTISVDPESVGNLLVLAIQIDGSGTNDISAVSGGGVQNWIKIGPSRVVPTGIRALSIWIGKVTEGTTGPQTVTLSSQGNLNNRVVNIAVQEFTSSVGVDAVWLVDNTSDGVNNTSTSTNVQFPTLTPGASKRAYIGYSKSTTPGQLTGQTAGYTVQLGAGGHPFVYNTNVSTVQSPIAKTADPGTSETIGILIHAATEETAGRGTWSMEFLARIDSGSGRLFTSGKWDIVALPDGSLTFRATGSGSGPSVPDAWTEGEWGHYVIAFNGEGLVFYVNGQDINTFFNTNIEGIGSSTLVFAPDNDMTVALDEVAVYPQFLNDGRVSAHYVGLSQAFAEYPLAARIEPPLITFNFDSDQIEQQLVVLVQYSGGQEASPVNAEWSISNPDAVEISEDGYLTALAPGISGITVVLPDLGLTAVAGVTVLQPEFIPNDETRAVYSEDSTRFVWRVNPETFQRELVATTHEYWEIDQGRLLKGRWVYDNPVPLATLAYNIATLEGREGIPVADTENVRIATRPGRRWIPKTPEQKQLTLAMWVLGADKEGRFPSDVYLRTRFWENYNALKKLFAVWDRQLLLTRRVPTRYGVIKMYAWVEPVSRMDLSPTGPMRATFTVDLMMADPFWFGDEQKADPVTVRAGGGLRNYPRTYRLVYSAHGAPGIVLLNNDGSHEARLKAIIHGPFRNPTLKNIETRESFRLVPDVPIERGTFIEIDFWEKTIMLNGTSSRYWWMDRQTDWLKLRPGYSRFMFTHEGWDEDSTVEWQWRPSYL